MLRDLKRQESRWQYAESRARRARDAGGQAGFTSFSCFDPLTSGAVIAAFNTNNVARAGGLRLAFSRSRKASLPLIK